MEELNGRDLLASIRTANRLTYEYQKRILEFISYFKMKFRLEDNTIAACKRDSDALGKTQAYTEDYREANIKVWTSMWAWDFIYTNLMEYYLGWTRRKEKEFCLSFLQMTDSGYYESSDAKKTWTAVSRYADIRKSHSYGFLILECSATRFKKYTPLWNVNREVFESWANSADDLICFQENDRSQYLVYRFNMEELFNQSSTDALLERYAKIVRQKTDIDLMELV